MIGTIRKPLFYRVAMSAATAMLCLWCLYPSVAYADECPAGGEHSYEVSILVYATETSDGTRVFECMKCGYNYQQIIPATGHQWSSWIVDVEPTCTTPGHAYRVCDRYPDNLHYEESEIPLLSTNGAHVYELAEELPGTCTEQGYRLYACSFCGTSYREELPPIGHEWGEWVVEVEPTVDASGRSKRVCLHDGTHIEYEEIPQLEKQEEEAPPVTTAEMKSVVRTVDEEQERSSYFFSGPNIFDAVVLTMDFVVLLVFLIAIIPLVYQMRWIKEKHRAARQKYIDQVHEGKRNR